MNEWRVNNLDEDARALALDSEMESSWYFCSDSELLLLFAELTFETIRGIFSCALCISFECNGGGWTEKNNSLLLSTSDMLYLELELSFFVFTLVCRLTSTRLSHCCRRRWAKRTITWTNIYIHLIFIFLLPISIAGSKLSSPKGPMWKMMRKVSNRHGKLRCLLRISNVCSVLWEA